MLTPEEEELNEGEQLLKLSSYCRSGSDPDCVWEGGVLYQYRQCHGFRIREFPYTLNNLTTKTAPISTGCILWESVNHLARYIESLGHDDLVKPWLELGCGVGLLGLLIDRPVVLSDHALNVVNNAKYNLVLNGKPHIPVACFDWNDSTPELELAGFPLSDFACVVGADVVWGNLGLVIGKMFSLVPLPRGIFCLDTSKVDGIPDFLAAMTAAGMNLAFKHLIEDRFLLLDFIR
jgi:hypothetical protein